MYLNRFVAPNCNRWYCVLLFNLGRPLTDSMQQIISWEANMSLASQRNSSQFMEPEGSLPLSQVPATCPYPEPHQISPCPLSHFLNIHLNILSHLLLDLQNGLFPSGFPHHNTVLSSPLPHSCYIPRQSHCYLFDHREWSSVSSFNIHYLLFTLTSSVAA